MDLLMIRTIPNERILNLRAINRLLQSEKFEAAFNKASDKDKEKLYTIIYNSNKELLRNWIKDILRNSIEGKKIKELRDEALKLGVKNASRLSKTQLQWELLNEKA